MWPLRRSHMLNGRRRAYGNLRSRAAAFYLHGQRTGFALLNTDGDIRKGPVMESPAFPPETERALIEHMNEFYADANLRYVKAYGYLLQATEARMVALDKAGMELEAIVSDGTRRVRIPFDHRLQDEGDAQQTLVEMSLNAREILAQQAHS